MIKITIKKERRGKGLEDSVARCFLAGLVCAALAGCANPDVEKTRDRRAVDFERSPALSFFNGEVNALFAAGRGFKAHLTVDPLTGPSKYDLARIAGELWGRDGKLFFIPEPSGRGHKYSGTAGTTFVWDNRTGEGFAVNELLEGIAPLARSGGTNATPESSEELGTESVGGEVCKKTRITYITETRTNILTVWRSPSLNGFPIQLQTGQDLNAHIVKFNKVRFETPPADVFVRPEGLTKYESVDAMLYELARRESETRGIHGLSPDYPAGIQGYRRQ